MAAALVVLLSWVALAVARRQCGPAEERGRLRFAGVVFHEKILRNSQQCFNLCWSTTPCKTVNFSFKTRKCSLMKTKHQRPTDLDVDFNNVYGVVSRPQCKSFRNPCDDRPCKESFTCFGYDKTHTCVPAKPPRIRCPPPKPLPNARVRATGRWRKKVATFTCKKGFKFKGNSNSSICTKHGLKGIWKGLDGKCIRLRCAEPVEVDNALLMPGPTLAGSTRAYTCNNVNQSVTVICHNNETWSSHHLHCPVDCGAPPNISNTVVSDGGTLEGSNRTYFCDENRVPSGNRYITCLTNSSWSKTDFKCKVDCGQPPPVPHANSTYNSTYLYGSATYECLRGYKAAGVNEQTCTANGHWSNHSFSCTEVQCVDPVEVEHVVHEGQGPWYSGDTLQLQCEDGFTASGNSQAFCGMDGTWLNVSLQCTEALPRVLVAVKETGKFHIIDVRTKETEVLHFESSKSVQDVDFCPYLKKLFWVEENSIKAANLTDTTTEMVVNSTGIGGFVRVDGQKNFVFYAIRGKKTKLMRLINGKESKTLTEVDAPLALEIVTQSELVYWAEWITDKQIRRMKYDGTDVQTVIKLHRCDLGPWAVHIDENKRMYWSVNDEVKYSDDNQDHNKTLSQFNNICDSIKTFRNMVFVSCTNDTTVRLHVNGTMQAPLSLNDHFSGEKFITIIP
ncbi:sushi, von Willebrand factor type A, EGF and pentraxin domain-containing protein 1-like [Haliotis rubra]|uniref:sushi, von Willebrand factor type A, EGF and pentraxin domain-containing protein 1-like n=1 Tax=Haliotis rubra TaxID=36100 RepID=UPI001EE58A17|nr:sushi, von Willebrand factor type A, EGF and pentraxin domain-containing protein 1-like [Haliotis rubra]